MKVSELIAYLEQVESEHGDFHVSATCEGWLAPQISIEVNDESEHCVLYGCRSVSEHPYLFALSETTVINAEENE